MRAALRRFLDDLEGIGVEHGELYDTDVREHLAEAIVTALIPDLGVTADSDEYGMFSREGNDAVRRAVERYLSAVVPMAASLALDQRERVAAVWDADAASSQGTTVDEFLGWLD